MSPRLTLEPNPDSDDSSTSDIPAVPCFYVSLPRKKPPQWLRVYIDMFTSDGLSQVKSWTRLLSLWIKLEAKFDFLEVEGDFGTRELPWMNAVICWRAEGRDPAWRPQECEGDSHNEEHKLLHFWSCTMPPWYSNGSAKDSGGFWEDWRLVGKSGWLDILASVFFAGRLGCTMYPMPGAEAKLPLEVSSVWYGLVAQLIHLFVRLLEEF
jgi:hypothetical protein